jgi:DNA-binding protein HU-beta
MRLPWTKALAVWLLTVIPGDLITHGFDSMASRPAAAAKALAPKASTKKAAAKNAPVQPPSASAASKPKPVAAPVVTLKTVFEQLAETHDLPKQLAVTLLADFVTAVTTHLKNGDRIRMSGVGILEVKTRAARMGRNPATGEAMPIKASRKVAFRAAKELKAAV